MSKRILSLVMVFCMMLSMVPAFADTATAPVDPCTCTKDNMVGPITYEVDTVNGAKYHIEKCAHGKVERAVEHSIVSIHSRTSMSCIEQCNVCGQTVSTATFTNVLGKDEDSHWIKCSLCDEYVSDLAHTIETAEWSYSNTAVVTKRSDVLANRTVAEKTYKLCTLDRCKVVVEVCDHSTYINTEDKEAGVPGYEYVYATANAHQVICGNCNKVVVYEDHVEVNEGCTIKCALCEEDLATGTEGHDFQIVSISDTQHGLRCVVCGAEDTNNTAVKDESHDLDFDAWWDADSSNVKVDATCSGCNYERTYIINTKSYYSYSATEDGMCKITLTGMENLTTIAKEFNGLYVVIEHTPTSVISCTDRVYCTKCLELLSQEVGHDIKAVQLTGNETVGSKTYAAADYHKIACARNNDVPVEYVEHSFNSYADPQTLKCVCGATKAAATECKHTSTKITRKGWAMDCKQKLDGRKDELQCTVCGEMVIDWSEPHNDTTNNYIIPWKHTEVKTVEVQPGCTKDGKWKVTCTVCQQWWEEDIHWYEDKEAHGPLVFHSVKTPVSCETDGVNYMMCSVCKNEQVLFEQKVAKTGHSKKSVVIDFVDGASFNVNPTTGVVTGYSVADMTTELNCKDGIFTYTGCANKSGDGIACDAILSDVTLIKNSAHDTHKEVKVGKVDETCTTPAGTKYRCGNKYCEVTWFVDDNGNVIDLTQLPTTHNFKGAEVKVIWLAQQTCTADGKIQYKCPTCDQYVKQDTAGNWIDTTSEYTVTLDKLTHTNNKNQITGIDHSTLEGHYVNGWSYTAPTCQASGYWESYCGNCGANHLVVTDEDTYYCAKSHEWIRGKLADGEQDCEEGVKYYNVCKFCNITRKWTANDTADTTLIGKDYLELVTPANGDPHDWKVSGTPVKAPTCSKPGYGLQVCSICGEKKYDVIDPTDDCTFAYTYKAPTCTEASNHGWYCTKCGALKEGTEANNDKNSVAALGHKMTKVSSTKICGVAESVLKYECVRTGCDYVEYVGASTDTEFYKGTNPNTANVGWNHDIDVIEVSKHSCTTDGVTIMNSCKRCGLFDGDPIYTIVKAAHVALNVADIVSDYDCQGEYDKFECKYCLKTVKVYKNDNELGEAEMDDISKHAEIKWNEIIPVDCTKDGFGTAYCAACGWSAEEPTTIPADHTWSKVVTPTVAPDCGSVGYGYIQCTKCGAVKEGIETIPATGKHTFVRKNVLTNSCDYASYVVYECSVCGAAETDAAELAKLGYTYFPNQVTFYYLSNQLDANGKRMEASKPLDNVIEVLYNEGTHNWGAESYQAATCTTPAGKVKKCTNPYCIEISIIVDRSVNNGEPLGHDVIEDYLAPTCYVGGHRIFSCYRCGEKLEWFSRVDGNEIYTYQKYIAPTGHKLAEDKKDPRAVAATCSTKGVKVMKCSECGYEELVPTTFNASKHVWETIVEIVAPTCKDTGLALQKCKYCANVQQVNVLPVAHVWDKGTVKSAANCAEEGVMTYKCTVEKCTATKEEIIPRTAHVMQTTSQAADCVKDAGIVTKCANCDLVTSFIKTGAQALGHKWSQKTFKAATCEKNGGYEVVCLREGCNASYLDEDSTNYPKLDHKGKTLLRTEAATCQTPETKVYYCPICMKEVKVAVGLVDPMAHVWKVTNTYGAAVTCANPGYVDATCTLCGVSTTKQWYQPACTWSDMVYTSDAIYRFCLVCGEIDSMWVNPAFTGFTGCAGITFADGSKQLDGAHMGLIVKDSKKETCTEAGEIGHIECTVCGTIIRQGGVIPAHKTETVAEVPATCTAAGTTAGVYCTECKVYVSGHEVIPAKGHTFVEVPAQPATPTTPGHKGGKQCSVCKTWEVEPEVVPALGASILRLCTLRSKAADYRDDNTSVVMAMLNTTDAITITGELVNEYYPVSTSAGEGFIHMSYIKVA